MVRVFAGVWLHCKGAEDTRWIRAFANCRPLTIYIMWGGGMYHRFSDNYASLESETIPGALFKEI